MSRPPFSPSTGDTCGQAICSKARFAAPPPTGGHRTGDVKQLGTHLPRAALWVVVLLLLAGTLAMVAPAQATSPNYTLTGYAYQPGTKGVVPAGAQVDLVSRATGAVFTTTVFGTGEFNFTTASTGGALGPGYWGVWVPPQGNLTIAGCKTCAPVGVFPVDQNTQFWDLNVSALTTTNYPVNLDNVTVESYNGEIAGTVSYDGKGVGGAQVQLLYPKYNNFVLVNNTTTPSGAYTLKVPLGDWVLKTSLPGATPSYNFTGVDVTSATTVTENVVLNTYMVSGFVNVAPHGSGVPNGGNATVWDGYNGYIYSTPTDPGGFYSFGTYPGNFTTGTSQSFAVILSPVGYATTSYEHVVTSGSPYSAPTVYVSPLTPAERGIYNTTLNFAGINVTKGTGSISVFTNATLGNNTVFANLPNASVGQMWAQLGLDFNHQVFFPASMLSDLYAWENSSGPFFPAIQAGTSINGTTFYQPTGSDSLASESTTCTPVATATCGLASPNSIDLAWQQQFKLNGTLYSNSSSYTISFGFAHPTSSDTYNYTVVLPAGYSLAADTAAPAATKLVAEGAGNSFTKFTLSALPSRTPSGTFSFKIVKYASLTPNVNASVSNFAFSSANVLNSTSGNYTVVVGVNQNVTFSALNSTYPAGTNGTSFTWVFGDGNSTTTSQPTTNHTYTVASGATPYDGKLTVTSSGGLVNSTNFFVWVGEGPVTAVISSNATASQNRTSGGVPYVFVNWSTVLHFNATASTALISPQAKVPGVLSVASFVFTAKGFRAAENYSVGQGAEFWDNWTYQFLGAGVYYSNHTTIGGQSVSFKGWQYNLTLTAWDGTGQSDTAHLIVLVNDTEAPVSSFQLLNSAGKAITGSGVAAAANLTAEVQFNGANASDPHNGSVTRYYWHITNSGNSSVNVGFNQTTVKPYPLRWLSPQSKPYTVNLTVWDLNGNKGWTTQSLAVTVNSTTAVIMSATNLTGPASLNAGAASTYWVNVTSGGGANSIPLNVQVAFYFTTPSGTNRNYIAGSPASVLWFNYTSGVVNSVSFRTGILSSMPHNVTYRAQITWTPAVTGNFILYANATASNEYAGNYPSGPQVTSMSISIHPNPTTQALEYAAIGIAVVVVIVAIVFLYRRRTGRTTMPRPTSRSGISRSKPSDDEEDDEDEDA